jgi:hypothetical protein
MLSKLVASVAVAAIALTFSTNVQGHEIFQDVLKEMYTLRSFSCKTCHQDSDNRKLRTAFAERIYQEMKDKGLSAKFATAQDKDKAAKEANADFNDKEGAVAEFEKMVAKDFKVAFKNVAQQKISFDDMFKQGLFNGARLDTKKIEAAKEAAKKAGEGN